MTTAAAFIHWDNYANGLTGRGLSGPQPLTYSSSQERLHSLERGDRLWLVSRCPDDRQYYFVVCLTVSHLRRNPAGTPLEQMFGPFAVVADDSRSRDLGKRFPAEGLLRAFEFQGKQPIKFGAKLGQSLQTIRFLASTEEQVLDAALERIPNGAERILDTPFGLWTKCESVYADYFLKNWQAKGDALAFLLYDSPPVLTAGAPIFIHSDKNLRLIATFRSSEFVSGHKYTVEAEERLTERERIWSAYRAGTTDPPTKTEFDAFWDGQNGVRALFLLENVLFVEEACQFKTYGRALEWGFPIGVGYRYLSLSQCLLLSRCASIPEKYNEVYLRPLLQKTQESIPHAESATPSLDTE